MSSRVTSWRRCAPGGADLIVANPPYLPTGSLASLAPEVRDHDPALALDGGPDGLGVIRRLVREARSRLAPEGMLALETAGGRTDPCRGRRS